MNWLEKLTVAAMELLYGANSLKVADCFVKIGKFYCDVGNYSEAEPAYRRALNIMENYLGPEHALVGRCLNNLAEINYRLGETTQADSIFHSMLNQAESLWLRSLRILESVYGPKSAEVATVLIGLGKLYCVQGKYDDAERLLQEGHTVLEKTVGEMHPDVAVNLNNLARLYLNQGRYVEAEPLFQRALEIMEKARPGHPAVATISQSLRELRARKGA